MALFKHGDRVRLMTQASSGQLGLVKDIIPNLTDEDRFQPYLVEISGPTGTVLEHYLEYELQHPFEIPQPAYPEPKSASLAFVSKLRQLSR